MRAFRASVTSLAVLTSVGLATPAMASPDFTDSGLGSLRLDMSAQEAAALGWIEPSPTPCNSGWQSARFRKSVQVGVWNEKVMYIATDSRKFATSGGVRVGDSVKRLKARYPVTLLGRNIYTNGPVFGVPGSQLFFPARKGKVDVLELANGFVPNGTEFEC